MRADDIAALLVAGMQQQATGNSDLGWHQGTVLAWDEATGLNTVQINGNQFQNLLVLSTSNSIMISPGDNVGILRVQSQYFILGRVQAPGAGAALRIQSNVVHTFETTTSPYPTYTDLTTVGPTVSNVYIGSSRRCLVLLNSFIQVSNSSGYMSFTVSGASSIAATAFIPAANRFYNTANGGPTSGGTVGRTVVVTAADGLQQGFNTFTAKYCRDVVNNGTGADFSERVLTVFPF